jgi:NTE family protein
MSLPGIFAPVENNNRVLVDGGMVDPIPTEALVHAGADVIIAINVSHLDMVPTEYEEYATKESGKIKMPGIVESTGKSLQALGSRLAEEDIKSRAIDIKINMNLGERDLLNFEDIAGIVKIGELAALEKIQEIKRVSDGGGVVSFLKNIGEETGFISIHAPSEDSEE